MLLKYRTVHVTTHTIFIVWFDFKLYTDVNIINIYLKVWVAVPMCIS